LKFVETLITPPLPRSTTRGVHDERARTIALAGGRAARSHAGRDGHHGLCHATASDSSDAAKRLAFGLAEAEQSQPRSEAFQSLSTTVLHNLCTHAMAQHPGDLALHQISLRTRPSPT
jgi:hypothetical protein